MTKNGYTVATQFLCILPSIPQLNVIKLHMMNTIDNYMVNDNDNNENNVITPSSDSEIGVIIQIFTSGGPMVEADKDGKRQTN